MSSLRDVPIMIRVRFGLQDVQFLLRSVAAIIQLPGSMSASERESCETDIATSLSIIEENMEVINAWTEAQPKIIRSQEAIRLDAEHGR